MRCYLTTWTVGYSALDAGNRVAGRGLVALAARAVVLHRFLVDAFGPAW